jgi:hypothetical protein
MITCRTCNLAAETFAPCPPSLFAGVARMFADRDFLLFRIQVLMDEPEPDMGLNGMIS